MYLDPHTRAAVVTLFGTIVFDTADGRICLNVRPDLGDAPRFQFAGELWLKRAQCHQVIEAPAASAPDVVKIGYPLAVALAQAAATQRARRS